MQKLIWHSTSHLCQAVGRHLPSALTKCEFKFWQDQAFSVKFFKCAFRSQHSTCDCQTCSTMTLDKYAKIPKVLDSMTNLLVLFLQHPLLTLSSLLSLPLDLFNTPVFSFYYIFQSFMDLIQMLLKSPALASSYFQDQVFNRHLIKALKKLLQGLKSIRYP